MYIDTHCHLYDERFTDVDKIVDEYLKYQVTTAINMGCYLECSKMGKAYAEKYPSVYFGAGFHPNDATKWDDGQKEEIKKLLTHDKCVCVGEIGLDYHYGEENKEKQKQVFIEQIKLAYEYNLPISIHSRDATQDTVNILKEYRDCLKFGGVMHCFSGSKETAKEYLDLGLYIGFGGTLTFKNARNLLEVASFCPTKRILTETDSPYLSPEPFRGQINTPKNIPIIVNKLATIKNIDMEEMAKIIMINAKNLFTKLN